MSDNESRKNFLILDERAMFSPNPDPDDSDYVIEACRGVKDLLSSIDSWHQQGMTGIVKHVDSGVMLGSIEAVATAERTEQERELRFFTGES